MQPATTRIEGRSKMTTLHRLFCLLGFSALAWPGAGCSSLDWNSSIPWLDKTEAPAEIAEVWAERVLHRTNAGTTRGFLGRLTFFPAESKAPTKVDGTLVIYAFDEAGRRPTDTRPDRKFVITPEQLPGHYHEAKFGPSYDVWIPWDAVGGPRKEITLIVRFEPEEGGLVIGQPSTQVLSGPSPQSERGPSLADLAERSGLGEKIRQVAYEEGSEEPTQGSQTERSLGLQTTTINVPPQFGRSPQARASQNSSSRSDRRIRRRGNAIQEAAADGAARLPAVGTTRAQTDYRPTQEAVEAAYPAANRPFVPPQPTRFERARPRALGEPIARPRPDRAPSRPRPGEQRSSLLPSRQPVAESECGWKPESDW